MSLNKKSVGATDGDSLPLKKNSVFLMFQMVIDPPSLVAFPKYPEARLVSKVWNPGLKLYR